MKEICLLCDNLVQGKCVKESCDKRICGKIVRVANITKEVVLSERKLL